MTVINRVKKSVIILIHYNIAKTLNDLKTRQYRSVYNNISRCTILKWDIKPRETQTRTDP